MEVEQKWARLKIKRRVYSKLLSTGGNPPYFFLIISVEILTVAPCGRSLRMTLRDGGYRNPPYVPYKKGGNTQNY
jgi:hypothetical protein